MVKQWDKERLYISCNYSFSIFFSVKILLAKLKNLYIQYAWVSIMKNHSSNQNVKVKKMVVFVTITIISLILVTFLAVL